MPERTKTKKTALGKCPKGEIGKKMASGNARMAKFKKAGFGAMPEWSNSKKWRFGKMPE